MEDSFFILTVFHDIDFFLFFTRCEFKDLIVGDLYVPKYQVLAVSVRLKKTLLFSLIVIATIQRNVSLTPITYGRTKKLIQEPQKGVFPYFWIYGTSKS